ncbi:MAG: hypothetical protein C5617_007825 [ANME-2 cluster archaeon]|jgi:hypothetical protein|nr:MAG: hypothetical protein C5617_007825 [ANME-2 cluster archaeon]
MTYAPELTAPFTQIYISSSGWLYQTVHEVCDWLLSEGMRTYELDLKVGKDTEGNYVVVNFTGTTPE